jgi:hypothetical protein
MTVLPTDDPSSRGGEAGRSRSQLSASSRKLFAIGCVLLGIVATGGWLYLIATAFRAIVGWL